MSVDRSRIRALVRRELERRLEDDDETKGRRGEPAQAAFLTIYVEDAPARETDAPPRPCVIEPSMPCVNSGYCKKLGY